MIARPDNSKPFILHTDASNQGGTLFQIRDDGLEHPVAFISCSLNPCEINYSTTEKELLAAQWCMKKFKHLLFGQKFDSYTDHQALRGIFNNESDDVSSRIVRLLSKTTDYHPNIIYKKGRDNIVADALSHAHFATPKQSDIDAPPMDDPLAHINVDLYNQLNSHEQGLEEILRKDNDFDPMQQAADRENLPERMADRRGFKAEDICPKVDNPRVYDITRNAYIWINENESHQLLSDFKNNKSKAKYFIVLPYISDKELNIIKNTTDKI